MKGGPQNFENMDLWNKSRLTANKDEPVKSNGCMSPVPLPSCLTTKIFSYCNLQHQMIKDVYPVCSCQQNLRKENLWFINRTRCSSLIWIIWGEQRFFTHPKTESFRKRMSGFTSWFPQTKNWTWQFISWDCSFQTINAAIETICLFGVAIPSGWRIRVINVHTSLGG